METTENPYRDLFGRQLAYYPEAGKTTARQRRVKLGRLARALEVEFRDEIREALSQDLRKPATETDLTEIYPILAEIRHARRNLREWMRPRAVSTPLALAGSSSRIRYESKGVCLILSPWNYPLNLALVPLVSALAAGNSCILKPSEHSPATSRVLKRIVEAVFEPREVALVEGGTEAATALLQLPFHHIFFTGSPRVGKIVMQAAALNLSSCTLELGGKSPAYIGESASLTMAARRIAWGKVTNAGQTCIAPDYVLVAESVREAFIRELCAQWDAFYPEGTAESQSLARIINDAHFRRLESALQEAQAGGAKIRYGGRTRAQDRFVEPTLLEGVPEDCSLLRDEIFGPILPLVSVSGPEEALRFINRRERPLSMYIFSRNRREIRFLEEHTRAGGSCVNHNLVHYANLELPFGGINNSGIGKSHGHAGFLEFSNQRPVLRQYLPSSSELVRPPYTRLRQRLADWTLRWL